MSNPLKRIQDLSARERQLVLCTSLVIFFGLGYLCVAEPLYVKWKTLHTETTSLSEELHTLQTLALNRDVIEENFSIVQNSIPVGESQETLEVFFLEEINAIAQSSGVLVGSLKPLSVENSGRFDVLHVQLHGTCEGHQIVKFLQLLQQSEHLIQCQDLTITAGRSRPPLSISMTVKKVVMQQSGAQHE